MAKTYNLIGYEIYERFKLLSISIQTPPTKTSYFPGENFDPTGMEVLAQFSDDISGLVTGYTWSPTTLTLDTTTITISYANGGIVATTTVDITVENPLVEIPYTNSSFTYNGSTKTPSWVNYDPDVMTIGGATSAINAGTYTTTFTLKEGYKWSDGTTNIVSKSWTIGKASGTLSLSSTSVKFNNDGDSTAITAYGSGGSLTASTSNSNIVTATVSGSQIKLQAGTEFGNATVTVGRWSTSNYTASPSVYISVSKVSVWTKTAEYNSYGTFQHVAQGTSAVAIIAGGGGGGGGSRIGGDGLSLGSDYGSGGGGGGEGGRVVLTPEISITAGTTYKIVVGYGGTCTTGGQPGDSGSSSSAFGYTASGGEGGRYGGAFATLAMNNGANGKTGSIREEQTFSGRSVRTYDGSSGGAGGGGGNGGSGSPILSPSTGGTGGTGGNGGDGGNGGAGGYTSAYGTTFYAGKTGTNGKTCTAVASGGGGAGGSGGGVYNIDSNQKGASGGSSTKGGSGTAGIVVIFEKGIT